MRRWWLAGPFAVCAAFVACSGSSSDAQVGADGGDEGSSSGSSGSSGSSSGSSGAVDAGPDTANCRAQGPYPPKSVVSVARSGATGAAPWTGPDNAKSVDGQFASADLTSATESEELHVTDFGFDIPSDSNVTGIEVVLDRQAPQKGVTDGFLFLLLDGVESPSSHFYGADWPDSIVGEHKYGTELDDWGMKLTAADVAKPTFGATIYAKRSATGSGGAANIDALRVIVNYCPP